MFDRVVFDLLDGVEVQRVIICAKLFSLEEVDGGLIELEDDDLIKKV